VGGDARAEPRPRLGAVVELDALVQAVAELLLGEDPTGPHVGGEDVDVVQALDGGAAPDVALGLVLQCGHELGRRAVALDLVEQLEDMAVRVGAAIGRAMPNVALAPPQPEPRRLDGGHAALERLEAPGPQRHVGHARGVGLGELQAIALVVAPAAQENRLPLARLDLHPEDVDEEAQALLGLGRQQLGVADVRDLVQGLGHSASTISRRPSRS
jgi:hypothetical protein